VGTENQGVSVADVISEIPAHIRAMIDKQLKD
jgi:hypothetical protein